MLVSNRQRVLAETGLLTLLAWMALTIAIQDPPRRLNAGDIPQLIAPHAQRGKPKAESVTPVGETTASDAAGTAVTPIVTRLNAIIGKPKNEPIIEAQSVAMPKGTVIRMGSGVVPAAKPKASDSCQLRDSNGKTRHGPVP